MTTEATTHRSQRHSRRLSAEERAARYQESLQKAQTGQSMTNYPAIIEGFKAKGIPEAEILPRENVLTFAAWKALGRSVKKGEHGVRVITVATSTRQETDPETGEEKETGYSLPTTTTVFHITQTEPITERPKFTPEIDERAPDKYFRDDYTRKTLIDF